MLPGLFFSLTLLRTIKIEKFHFSSSEANENLVRGYTQGDTPMSMLDNDNGWCYVI